MSVAEKIGKTQLIADLRQAINGALTAEQKKSISIVNIHIGALGGATIRLNSAKPIDTLEKRLLANDIQTATKNLLGSTKLVGVSAGNEFNISLSPTVERERG